MSRLPAAQRREQLLDSAETLFARHGYVRATTAELARAAGVTEPIIYRHFDSKKDLFISLIERTAQRTIHQWEQQLAHAADPVERLRRLLYENPMVRTHGRSAYRVIVQAVTETADAQIQAALAKHIDELHTFVKGEIERAQRDVKGLAKYSADMVAWVLIHLALGYGLLSVMGIPGHGVGRDSIGASVRESLARLLGVAPPSTPRPDPEPPLNGEV
ncbi:MAG: TetR/AcrR family transcriptional regulator [Phycisphaerae bacterium]|nr:TetR/AcrR family transcriptional regulator [Phycisphaerae bacterium]